MALPGTEDRLLLEPTGDGYVKVLVVERSDGSHGWHARPPEGDNDAWVSVRVEGDTALAYPFSGWLVRLDPGSGRELERTFTK